MTDLFGPWDALLLLLVGLCMAGLRWTRLQRRKREPEKNRVPLTTAEQVKQLFSEESRLKRRYLKPDARWTAPLRRVK